MAAIVTFLEDHWRVRQADLSDIEVLSQTVNKALNLWHFEHVKFLFNPCEYGAQATVAFELGEFAAQNSLWFVKLPFKPSWPLNYI